VETTAIYSKTDKGKQEVATMRAGSTAICGDC